MHARSTASHHTGCHRTSCLAVAVLLSACTTLNQAPINPRPLNADAAVKVPHVQGADAVNPYTIPAERYLRSIAALEQSAAPTQAQYLSYADTGIALVQVQCLRWFSLLSNSQHMKDFQDSNYNVIRQLGTALLGIGKANPIIVATYGAGNTAYEGVSNNFEAAFLGAPNGKKVKQKIMQLLDDQEASIYSLSAERDVTTLKLYRKLERYADICTHSTARELVSTALDQASATIDGSGTIKVLPNMTVEEFTKAKAAQEASLRMRVNDADAARAKSEALVNSLTEASATKVNQLETRVQQLTDEVLRLTPPAAPASAPK